MIPFRVIAGLAVLTALAAMAEAIHHHIEEEDKEKRRFRLQIVPFMRLINGLDSAAACRPLHFILVRPGYERHDRHQTTE